MVDVGDRVVFAAKRGTVKAVRDERFPNGMTEQVAVVRMDNLQRVAVRSAHLTLIEAESFETR